MSDVLMKRFIIKSKSGNVLFCGEAANGEHAMDQLEADTGVPFDVTRGMMIERVGSERRDQPKLAFYFEMTHKEAKRLKISAFRQVESIRSGDLVISKGQLAVFVCRGADDMVWLSYNGTKEYDRMVTNARETNRKGAI